MTALQHNKIIGILHLAFAGFTVLVMVLIIFFMIAFLGAMSHSMPPEDDFPFALIAIFMVFMLLINVVLVAPSFVAGYGLLKRKSWAKTVGLIAAVVATLSFPHGVALCVYTLWFLFGDSGKALYNKAAYSLPPPPPIWAGAAAKGREHEYVPPLTPPDWR